MSDTSPCPKCGSTEIVPRARIFDRGDHNLTDDLRAGLEKNPDALFFKHPVKTGLYARICAECGFTELYAESPRAVYEAYLATRHDRP